MNKIYRTVYNETTGTWVAVCETAKTHTKSSGKSSVVKAAVAAGLVAVAGVAGAASLKADLTNPAVAGGDPTSAKRLKAEAVEAAGGEVEKDANGNYVFDADGNPIVITPPQHTVNTTAKDQVAVGDNAHSNNGGAVAVGSNSYAGGAQSVAVGMGASSNGGGAVAIGGGVSRGTLQGAVANGNGAVSIGVSSVARDSAVAIGSNTTARGEGSVSIGGTNGTYHSDTLGKGTVAIGRNARAKVSILERDAATHKINESQLISTTNKKILTENRATDRYLAFGQGGAQLHSDLNLGQNIAIGDESQAYSHQSIAVGANTMALGVGAIAIGGDDLGQKSDLNKKDGDGGYDAGFTASMKTLQKVDTSLENIRNDYDSKAQLQVTNKPRVITNTLESNDKAYVDTTMAVGDGSMAIGFKSAAKGSLSDAIGMGAMATGDSSLAVGTAAEAQGEFSNAIGAAAFAKADNANAFGLSAIAEGEYSNAIGTSAASGEKSSAMGYMNRAIGANAVAVGTQNLSGGANTQDTVAMGVDNEATGDKSVAIGASFEESTTTGTVTRKNQATGSNSIVIGSGNAASHTESVAIGKGNTASGYQSLAYGSGSTTSGDQSISFGSGNEVQSVNAGAFGTGSQILTTNANKNANASYSVGNRNTITSDNTFVLGNHIGEAVGQPNATLRNSVYLGNKSTTTTTGTRASLEKVNSATVGGITYGATLNNNTGFAGHTPTGIVSVGSDTAARRIQNVAAGEISETSTDAINGSQLYAVLPKYTNENGDPAADSDTVSSVTIGGNTYNFASGTDTVTDITANNGEQPDATTGNLVLTKDDSNADNPIYDISLNDTVDLSDSGSLKVGGDNTDSPTTFVEAGNVTVDDGKGNSVEIAGDNINFTHTDGGSVSGLSQHFIFTANDTAPTKAIGTTDDQAATVGDVRNVGWQLQVGGVNKDFINHGDVLDFQAGDGATVAFDSGVITYAVDKNPTDPTINTNVTEGGSGTVTGGVDNKYWDSNQVQQAINDAGWKIGTGAAANSNDALINAGGRVGLIAGDGVKIEQDTSNFTFSGVSIVDDNGDSVVDELKDADGNSYTISSSGGGQDNWNLTVDNANATSPNAKRNLKDSATVDVTQSGNDISFNVITTPLSVVDSGDKAGSVNTVKSEDENKLVTAGDVANVVNNTYWTASDGSNKTPVKASDTVTFKGKTDGNVTVTNNNGTFEFAVKTADKDPTVTGITSKVGGADGDILTAKQITQTINRVAQNWKWNIQGQDDGVNQNGGKAAEVKYNNTVNINAGKGLSLNQNGQTLTLNSDYVFKNGDTDVTDTGGDVTKIETTDGAGKTVTYNITGGGSGDENWNLIVEDDESTGTAPGASVKRNLKNGDSNIDIQQDNAGNIYFDLEQSITVGHPQNGAPVTIDGNNGEIRFANNGGEIKFEGNNGIINGVASHFDDVGSATEMPANNTPNKWSSKTNQAATLGDVLNAGWGLKANDKAVDFVAHGDTVNFVSSDNSISIDSSVDKEGINSQIDLSANVKFYSDDAGITEATGTNKAKSVKVGDTLYQLGGDDYSTHNYYGGDAVDVKGAGAVKVDKAEKSDPTDPAKKFNEYTVSIETTTPTVNTDITQPNVGKVVITSGDENKIVTAGDLATAINNSGWVASDGTNKTLVQAGNTATIQGKNGVKVGLDKKTQTFTVESDYVFKDGQGADITNKGGDVATITTKDDKGNDVTYNFGDGNDNTITAVTVNGGQNATTNAANGGNLKLTESKDADGNPIYDIALNNNVELGDDKGNSGSLNVNNGTGGSTNIEGNKITFGDTTTPNSGSIDGLAQHFTKTGDKTAPSETADTTSGKADNQAATVGDVKNVGWNLKVGDTVQDFVNHGDTVAFADGTGTKAKYDDTTGAISFDIAKAGDSKVDTTVTNANAGKVTGGTGDQYWDSTQVQTAINNAGWKAGVGATANAKDELINAGDRVGLVAGQGVTVTQDGSNFTFATDYVFKDGKGDDITNKGGDVATITTKDDKGNDVTYNFGDGNDNTVTAVTVNGGQDATDNAKDGGNLKLTETKDANGNPIYDIALNDEVDLTDKGSLKVGGDDIANGSPVTNITAGNIDFGDTQGSITNVASHLKDPASKDDKGQVINPDNAPANFNSVKNEAATVGDVLNAGWNLKVGGQDADFVQHGDTVAFGNGTGTTAQYDAQNGVISFDITKAKNPTVPTTGNNAGKVTGGTANQYWDSVQVQDAINGAGWFATAGKTGSGKVSGTPQSQLVTAGNEVKFIAGDGMEIEQNGSEFTFKVTGGGSGTGTGTGTGGGWTVIDPNNPKDIDINGGGQDVEFVGDVNTSVNVNRPTNAGDPVGIQVGLNDKVYVGGTSDGTATGTPNAGSVTIDGSNPNGAGAITFNNTNPDNSVTVNGDSGSLNLSKPNPQDPANPLPVNITNVAPGENRTDAVDVGQLVDTVGAANTTPATNSKGTQLNVVQTTTQPIDENGNPVGNPQEYTLKTYNVKDQGEYLTNNVVEAVSKMNEQGIKFFHTNEDENFVPTAQDHNQVDSSASGGLSTAIGVQAKATGKQAIVVGNKSEANGVQSIAVGTQVVVNGDHSGGIGDPTIIDGSNSYSVGNHNTVATDNTFVLGNNVTKTAENSVFLGNFAGTDVAGAGATGTVSNATLGGVTYGNFAGAKADGLVAVGGNGQVRRVSGVAAGEISATSTDAINGSQLYFALPDYVNGNGTTVEIGDAKDPITGDPTGRKTVSINIVPGYSAGLEAGNNVELETKPVLDQDGNQLYIDSSGNSTTAATDPTGTPNKRQETTVIHAKQPDLRPIEQHVQQVENNAYAGVAQAMATAGLPQAYLPGKSMVAISGGHYKGEQGYALGLSSISDSGNWVFKATASGNSRGNVGGTIGAGYQW